MKREDLDEGKATFARISELKFNPVRGDFDAAHLQEIHRRILQDKPDRGPGQLRPAAPTHYKYRSLEATKENHPVYYAHRDEVDKNLDLMLKNFGGTQAIEGLTVDQFATKMANLYSQADRLHAFAEGNSRTLRVFTDQLAREAGFDLDWRTTNVTPQKRDELYVARDIEVTKLNYPGLDRAKALATKDKQEYEAYALLLQQHPNAKSLKDIIAESTRLLTPQERQDVAEQIASSGDKGRTAKLANPEKIAVATFKEAARSDRDQVPDLNARATLKTLAKREGAAVLDQRDSVYLASDRGTAKGEIVGITDSFVFQRTDSRTVTVHQVKDFKDQRLPDVGSAVAITHKDYVTAITQIPLGRDLGRDR